MKKNGKGSFLAALWWLMACLCLGALLVLLAPRESRVSETERRMLAGFPELPAETRRYYALRFRKKIDSGTKEYAEGP